MALLNYDHVNQKCEVISAIWEYACCSNKGDILFLINFDSNLCLHQYYIKLQSLVIYIFPITLWDHQGTTIPTFSTIFCADYKRITHRPYRGGQVKKINVYLPTTKAFAFGE